MSKHRRTVSAEFKRDAAIMVLYSMTASGQWKLVTGSNGPKTDDQKVGALHPYPTIDTLPNDYVASEQVLSLLLHDSLSRFRRST